MLGLVVTTDDKMYKKDFAEPLYLSVGKTIGGFEPVYPRGLQRPFCFMVDDDGLRKGLPVNPVGTAWYDALPNKIHGDIVVVKTEWTDDGRGIVSLTEEECDQIINLVYEMTDETVSLIKEPQDGIL